MTNSTLETINNRRSTRSFADKKIDREALEIIASSAYKAPTGMNKQTWKFSVVQNKDLLHELYTYIAEKQNRGSSYNFYNADTLIIAASLKENQFSVEDCACALENMFLASESLGIGSVWINQLNNLNDDPDFRAILSKIGITDAYNVYGSCALGYPASDAKMTPTAKNADVISWYL